VRRLLRILFNTLTLLSALLFLATAALWARSYATADRVIRNAWDADGDRTYWAQSDIVVSRGTLWLFHQVQAFSTAGAQSLRSSHPAELHYSAESPRATQIEFSVTGFSHAGFRYKSVSKPDSPGHSRPLAAGQQASLPLWSLLPPLAILPTIRAIRHRRRRKRAAAAAAGLCPTCGYDLRASPDRCPECGTAPAVR
jgi:hypothetical protein